MDHRRSVLRVAHRRAQRGDRVGRRRRDPTGLLVGRVLVEVGERVVVGHGSLRLRPVRRDAQDAALRWRPDEAGHQGGVDLVDHRRLVDDDLADVGTAGQVVHRVEQHLFEDGAQAAGAGAAQDRLIGDRLQAVRGELEFDVFEAEHLLVLLDQAVLRLDEDLHERVAVEAADGTDHRQATDELGDHAELHEVFGQHLGEQFARITVDRPNAPCRGSRRPCGRCATR